MAGRADSALNLPQLGFGCAYLAGGAAQGASTRLVHAALEAGLRHFDVAPPYGLGGAEAALGAALAGRRDEVSIATKVGLPRPTPSRLALALRALPPQIRRAARSVRPQAPVSSQAAGSPRGQFDLPFVRASVDRSLKDLRTDRLDVLLLHEVAAADLSPEFIDFLVEGRAGGRFRAIGLGAQRREAEAILRLWPDVFDVIQYSWSLIDPEPPIAAQGLCNITHRSILGVLEPVASALAIDAGLRAAVTEAGGGTTPGRAELARGLLAAAALSNPHGTTLFGTREAARVAFNAACLHEPRARELGEALLQNRSAILQTVQGAATRSA